MYLLPKLLYVLSITRGPYRLLRGPHNIGITDEIHSFHSYLFFHTHKFGIFHHCGCIYLLPKCFNFFHYELLKNNIVLRGLWIVIDHSHFYSVQYNTFFPAINHYFLKINHIFDFICLSSSIWSVRPCLRNCFSRCKV